MKHKSSLPRINSGSFRPKLLIYLIQRKGFRVRTIIRILHPSTIFRFLFRFLRPTVSSFHVTVEDAIEVLKERFENLIQDTLEIMAEFLKRLDDESLEMFMDHIAEKAYNKDSEVVPWYSEADNVTAHQTPFQVPDGVILHHAYGQAGTLVGILRSTNHHDPQEVKNAANKIVALLFPPKETMA